MSVGAEMLFCKDGCSAAVDTGASYITGPAGPISVLMKAIGAAEMAEGGVSIPPNTPLHIPTACTLGCLNPSPSQSRRMSSALPPPPAVRGGL